MASSARERSSRIRVMSNVSEREGERERDEERVVVVVEEEEEEKEEDREDEGLQERRLRDLRDCTSSRSVGGKRDGLIEKIKEERRDSLSCLISSVFYKLFIGRKNTSNWL